MLPYGNIRLTYGKSQCLVTVRELLFHSPRFGGAILPIGNTEEPSCVLRPGELFALRWRNVQEGRLQIEEAVYHGELGPHED